MIGIAASAIVVGIGLVRLGWSRWRMVAALGWLLAGAALVVFAHKAGAWGLAFGTVTGMAAALAALAWSGWATPGRARRPERERVATAAAREPAALARRASVFTLVVPVGGAASLWLAFAIQAAARRAGLGAADASACLLVALPLLWCGMMTWQMTRDGPRRMIAPPLLVAALGIFLSVVVR